MTAVPPDGNQLSQPTEPSAGQTVSEHELLRTLFDLGREVTSVLDRNELLRG